MTTVKNYMIGIAAKLALKVYDIQGSRSEAERVPSLSHNKRIYMASRRIGIATWFGHAELVCREELHLYALRLGRWIDIHWIEEGSRQYNRLLERKTAIEQSLQ